MPDGRHGKRISYKRSKLQTVTASQARTSQHSETTSQEDNQEEQEEPQEDSSNEDGDDVEAFNACFGGEGYNDSDYFSDYQDEAENSKKTHCYCKRQCGFLNYLNKDTIQYYECVFLYFVLRDS